MTLFSCSASGQITLSARSSEWPHIDFCVCFNCPSLQSQIVLLFDASSVPYYTLVSASRMRCWEQKKKMQPNIRSDRRYLSLWIRARLGPRLESLLFSVAQTNKAHRGWHLRTPRHRPTCCPTARGAEEQSDSALPWSQPVTTFSTCTQLTYLAGHFRPIPSLATIVDSQFVRNQAADKWMVPATYL